MDMPKLFNVYVAVPMFIYNNTVDGRDMKINYRISKFYNSGGWRNFFLTYYLR